MPKRQSESKEDRWLRKMKRYEEKLSSYRSNRHRDRRWSISSDEDSIQEKPSPVKGCDITHRRHDARCARCTPARDGGMPQTFLLQIVETSTGALLCNITNVTPEFFVTGLHFSNSLSVSVSDAVTLTPALLKLSQKHTEKPSPVKGCDITHRRHDARCARCTPARDGGMPQTFLLQIVETSRGALLCNITNVTPEFFVTGLHFSNSLSVSVSDAVTLTPALLKLSQKHTDAPLITLELGANLDAYKVVEGSDVYLDCRVKANPWHTLVYFTHNGVLVKPGPGVVLANQSLVLQRVSRKAAGDYVCLARNSLGEGFSDKLKLDVKYTPTCKSNHTTIIRAAIGEVVDID